MSSVSPWDDRYRYTSNILEPFISDQAIVNMMCLVEKVWAEELGALGLIPKECGELLPDSIGIENVRAYEAVCGHETVALVRALRASIPRHKQFVHYLLTSSDVQDTARMACMWQAWNEIQDYFADVEDALVTLREKHAGQPWVGRTHGQWAVPMKADEQIQWWLDRLRRALDHANGVILPGKLSGAVGNFSVHRYVAPAVDWLATEHRVLHRFGLAQRTSSQVIPPEPVLEFLHAVVMCVGVLANIADDLRHLCRSEIQHAHVIRNTSYVGSSAMPQKSNPWEFEHVVSVWRYVAGLYTSNMFGQIVGHQRDLSNSVVERFRYDILLGALNAAQCMCRTLPGVVLQFPVRDDQQHMQRYSSTAAEAVRTALYTHKPDRTGLTLVDNAVHALIAGERDAFQQFVNAQYSECPGLADSLLTLWDNPATLCDPTNAMWRKTSTGENHADD